MHFHKLRILIYISDFLEILGNIFSPSQNMESKTKCTNCKVNHPNSGKSWCQSCYLKQKDQQTCTKCKLNQSNSGKSLCQTCYLHHKNQPTLYEFINDVKKIKKSIKSKDNVSGNMPSALRHEVWKNYVSEIYRTGKCFCCRTSEIEESNFECGHVISRKAGGPISLQNLRPLCGQCNKSMGPRDMDEFIISCGFWKENYKILPTLPELPFTPLNEDSSSSSSSSEELPKLTLKSKPIVDIYFRLQSQDGETIDQIRFVISVLKKFTVKTKEKQNVTKEHFCSVVYNYAVEEKQYKALNFLADIKNGEVINRSYKLYKTTCPMSKFYDSVINIMKSLEYTLGNYKVEKYKCLTWNTKVSKFEWFES